MMLDWLANKHDYAPARAAAQQVEAAVDKAFQAGIRPREFGGPDGTAAVAKAVLAALD
jgi:3-isopropylmalate dehydrogenase